MPQLQPMIDRYLEHCRSVRRLSPYTIAAYKSDLAQFAAKLGLNCELTPQSVHDGLTRIAEDQGLAPASVKRKIATVRAFLRTVDRHLALQAFASWRVTIRMPSRLPRAIAATELSTLLEAAKPSVLLPMVNAGTTHLCLTVLAATGLRVSELCALSVGHVRVLTGEIVVLGKGARERIVIVANPDIRRAIADHVAKMGAETGLDAPLFLNTKQRRLTPQCLRLRLNALVDQSKLQRRITPHMLRHTAATLLLESGVDTRFVQRLLGHASIATTQIYTHVSDVALRRALESADVMRRFV